MIIIYIGLHILIFLGIYLIFLNFKIMYLEQNWNFYRPIKLFLLFFIPKKYKKKEIDLKGCLPYVIKIKNNTNETIKNFKILSFLEYQNSKYLDKEGNVFIKKDKGEITIKSEIPDISYNEILHQFMNQPLSVGLTYIACCNHEQILKIIKVITKDVVGNEAHKTLVPTFDPYQQQKNIVAVKYNYGIDMFTEIIYSELLPNTILNMYFYPEPIAILPKTRFEKFVAWLKK